jgi:hypothetical protein
MSGNRFAVNGAMLQNKGGLFTVNFVKDERKWFGERGRRTRGKVV